MIKLHNVTKTYQMEKTAQTVLHDIDLNIHHNELTAIMGASGSGKSTLMNIIGLLDKPSSGTYFLDDCDIANLSDNDLATMRNHKIGFVFQQFFLLPRLRAVENVALPLTYRGIKTKEAKEQAMAMLAKMNMQDRHHHYPNELSGGQQQRVALARALVGHPEIILADEPTGALDSQTGQEVMNLFLQLHEEAKTTVIIVTHDPKISTQCKRVIQISDGRIMGERDIH